MSSDSITERRAAWQLCLDEITPQIRGLEDQVNDALSEELRIVLTQRMNYLKQRENLIRQAMSAQDAADAAQGALEEHGFPSVPDMEIPGNLMEELNREVADSLAARNGFEVKAQASSIELNLGTPTDTP